MLTGDSTGGEEFEDDTKYSVQTAQIRLKRKKQKRIALSCICFLVVLIFIIIWSTLGVILSFAVKKNDDSDTNTSQPTTRPMTSPGPTDGPPSILNSKVLDYIDTSYDPCEDFYQFSCGRWHSNHPDASEWGTQDELGFDNYNNIAGYLSQWPNDRDPDAIKKAKTIYTACMDVDYINNHYVEELKSFMINKGGGWTNMGIFPAQSWSITDNLYKDHYLGSSAFFNFRIAPDDLRSNKSVIKVRSISYS